MASLELAMPYLLVDEGYYSNISGDSGKETYCGISRANHPEWPGWEVLDSLNLPPHNAAACDNIIENDGRAMPLVVAFYEKTYWNFDGIQSQDVATKVFDTAVHEEGTGKAGSAIKVLQQAANVQFPGIIRLDGVYGPNTELMVNRCDPEGLLRDYMRFELKYIDAVLLSHPEDEKFRRDWERRALRIPTDGKAASA